MRLHGVVGFALLIVVSITHTVAASLLRNGLHPASETEGRFLTTSVANTRLNGDDAERAGLSVPVVEKIKTFFSSSKVTPAQLGNWLKEGKSADTVFTRLRLNKADDMLLYYGDFVDWLKYVDDLSAKNPGKKMSAISTLTKQYGDGDLYSIIQAAMNVPRTKSIATRLQTEQIQHWVTAGKTPDDVFHFMKLEKVERNFLSDPAFTVWAKYVDDFNAKYPEKSASMVPVLTKYHINEVTLFEIVQAAKSMKGTKAIATKLEDQLVKFWLNRRKSPDDALEDLGLSYALDSLLDNPLFNSWAKYPNAYSTKHPEEKATVIETLTRRFSDDKGARVLAVAKTSVETRNLATKLESAQLEMWQKSGKSVDDVMLLLKLRPNADFTNNLLLRTWVSYMNMYIKENHLRAPEMLPKLETRFDQRTMNQILLAATQFSSMKSTALAIQTEKIKGYLASNQSPEKVFKLLALDNVGKNLLGDHVFQMWRKYVNDFNKRNPRQRESWFTPMRMTYNPAPLDQMISVAMESPSTVNIAKLVVKERSKYWLDRKKAPWQIFRDLELNGAGEKIFASPNFKIWANYLNKSNQRYRKEKTTMIDGLRASYNDISLMGILAAAKKEPKTKKLATDLENALVNKWVAEKEPLAVLQKRFDHVPSSGELLKRYVAKLDALAAKGA
uniref:Avh456 n=1 Tax=Phytophthora sojae TaxID=67593 RepID=G1FTD4_PHYSO|nr:Avh456 [Phytophthora sojae]